LVDDMHALSSLQVSLQVRSDASSTWTTAVSTLPLATRGQLEKQAALALEQVNGNHATASSAAGSVALALSLLDNEYSGRTVMLAEHDGAAVSALLLRSVDDAVAPYRQLQLGLAALTLVGVLVFGIGS